MTIDPKLKAVLIKKIILAQKDLEDDPGLKVKLEGKGRSASLGGDVERPQNALHELVRRKLLKERLWEPVEAELARIALAGFIREFERKQGAEASRAWLSAAREKQMVLFPGFESLPTRIRSGSGFVQFPELNVSQFLAYQRKYEARAQRNHKLEEELQRLAKSIEFLEATDPELSLPEAFRRAQAQPPMLTVVKNA